MCVAGVVKCSRTVTKHYPRRWSGQTPSKRLGQVRILPGVPQHTNYMTSEDTLAAKLKGYNCIIKFKDGEDLLVKVPDIDDADAGSQWFLDVEKFINKVDEEIIDYFPLAGISISRDSIKYVMKL